MPVLRDNFWLTAHVTSIVASYGAAALAWGLGNVALCVYLFGHYRDKEPSADGQILRRPPAACATLAVPTYKAIKAAVWLLAVGIILGALWGDVAWGGFWGWDSKEVWSLVSLLVYLAVLHSRSAGIAGNFGITLAALLGASSILMAWYGVNYVLGTGMHSYADGAAGYTYVVISVLANWLLLLMAAIRYAIETRIPTPVPTDS
jgi:ABC-type transport system involved in cytochrome c biogenesis permease subunit